MASVTKRIQTQTSVGSIDRVFTIMHPPSEPHEAKMLRGTWFTAKSRAQADSGMAMLEQLCLDAARHGRARDCLRELDYRKGANIHSVHREVEPKILKKLA